MPTLVDALRARDRQLGLVAAEEDGRIASPSLKPPLNFNSRRDIPVIGWSKRTSETGGHAIANVLSRYRDAERGAGDG